MKAEKKKYKSSDLASTKVHRDALKAAKKKCIDADVNLYVYLTEAIEVKNKSKS